MSNCTALKYCLSCSELNLIEILNLGNQPLANNYSDDKDNLDEEYPLRVNLCRACFHLQLSHIVNPKIIYDNYLYVSGTTTTLKEYSEWFANFVNENIVRTYSNILDIGCNDGTQLDYFKKLYFETYGVDPAKNLYSLSSINHNTYCSYFDENIVNLIEKKFDAIIAQNVFAHNPSPIQFLNNCMKIMHDHSLLFIQTSQADMVLNNEFDTIYHEHINFFNVNSMKKCVERSGLYLQDVIKTPVHGTSYIFIIGKKNKGSNRIQNAVMSEKKLLQEKTYFNWNKNITSNCLELKNLLANYKNNYKLVGYGAAAKGNTFLNFTKLELDFIIDDNKLKQGKYTPGMKIPIVPIEKLQGIEDNILFIPLAWNFYDEIKRRIKIVRNSDQDIFVKYFPKVEIDG